MCKFVDIVFTNEFTTYFLRKKNNKEQVNGWMWIASLVPHVIHDVEICKQFDFCKSKLHDNKVITL